MLQQNPLIKIKISSLIIARKMKIKIKNNKKKIRYNRERYIISDNEKGAAATTKSLTSIKF